MYKIAFNVPPFIGGEDKKIKKTIDCRKISGGGEFTKKCNSRLEDMTGSEGAYDCLGYGGA